MKKWELRRMYGTQNGRANSPSQCRFYLLWPLLPIWASGFGSHAVLEMLWMKIGITADAQAQKLWDADVSWSLYSMAGCPSSAYIRSLPIAIPCSRIENGSLNRLWLYVICYFLYFRTGVVLDAYLTYWPEWGWRGNTLAWRQYQSLHASLPLRALFVPVAKGHVCHGESRAVHRQQNNQHSSLQALRRPDCGGTHWRRWCNQWSGAWLLSV